MRLWSLHPAMLDRAALVACWREGLLAQAVLLGRTRGYTAHPQLERFRATHEPVGVLVAYLAAVADEADARGYRFDRGRLDAAARQELGGASGPAMEVTEGQLALEAAHLRAKVEARDPQWLPHLEPLRAHPSFTVTPGGVASWERAAPRGG